MANWEIRCRAGHLNCRIPWGYDGDHTDSDRPYTLDELAARRDPPHRYAYPTVDEYVFAFKLWRSLRRDACQSDAEREVVWRWRVGRMVQEMGRPELLTVLDGLDRLPAATRVRR